MWKRFFGTFALLLILALLFNYWAPPAAQLRPQDFWGRLIYLLLLLSFLGARGWTHLARQNRSRTLRYALAWLGIFLMVSLAYSYRFELDQAKDRLLATWLPGRPMSQTPGRMRFPRAANGHFYIKAHIDGIPVRFLADTGASDIVLSPQDARRLGFDPDQLSYDRIYQTANGIGRGASVRLFELKVGDLVLKDIRATVNRAALSHSLLGMRFFNRLKAYEVKNGILTLYWQEGKSTVLGK